MMSDFKEILYDETGTAYISIESKSQKLKDSISHQHKFKYFINPGKAHRLPVEKATDDFQG